MCRRDPCDSGRGEKHWPPRTPAVAIDHIEEPERLDRSQGARWTCSRRILASPPDSDSRRPRESSPPWLRSYRPDDLFDAHGRLRQELRSLAPTGERRMSASPHANGGQLRVPLRLPDFRTYTVTIDRPGGSRASATERLGRWLRDVMRDNPRNFRVFGPDETASNRLQALYETSKKMWLAAYVPQDADGGELAPDGRVMELLSEHTLEGWAEGYVL